MQRPPISRPQAELGAALVIVLAFVVLLTGVIVAFLTRTTTERQASNGSANQAKADILARSGLAFVVSQLKQEIEAGSAKSTVNGITLYTPSAPANILPTRSGVPAGTAFANMIRRSIDQGDSTAAPNDPSQASAVNSETNPSLDGRSISKARWNAHYLIGKADLGNDATDPDDAFISPDWVLVTRAGIAVKSNTDVARMRHSANADFALGRFAYVIYDEGGLLDINVAGYPTDANQAGTAVATDAPVGGKGCPALADLVPVIPANTIPDQRTAINKIVGWRNFATAQPGGSFPNFTFTMASGSTWYKNFVANNTSGFLKISSTNSAGPTDQAFSSRQQLIKLRRSLGISINALQYLGTFSRELNNPTWSGAATQRVTAAFTRRDGSISRIGEPLLRRFPISQLAWLGPNGVRAPGTPATVKRDFGLVWNADHWDYYGPTGSTLASVIPPVVGAQEPDFFQLLAMARPAASIQQILTTGACLVDQFDGDTSDPSSLTTRIDFSGPPTPPSITNSVAWGMETITPPAPMGAPTPQGALVLNRPFNNSGEFGYANRDVTAPAPAATPPTLDFYSNAAGFEPAILDLFGTSSAPKRAGTVNLNTRQELVLRALISFATATQPSTAISSARRNSTAAGLVAATTAVAATSRQDLANLAFQSGITGGEEIQEIVARSLAETCQTRTWNLMIDIICQSGRYPPAATSLPQFVVEGERRYWLHVAIDRFTGEVIDRQLEAIYE
jgi:Tfp pilus assembly protein PilX